MQQTLQQLAAQQGWQIHNVSPVHGGDINQAFRLQTDKGRFFLKLNDARKYPNMFAAEADGLRALQTYFPLKVPTVIAYGQIEKEQYLLLEWLQTIADTPQASELFGRALAQLHQNTHQQFGWHQSNYLGSLQMGNDWRHDWPTFYTTNRILPFVKMLRDQNTFSKRDGEQAETFCSSIHHKMPTEPPALLHGDLWSGNASTVMINHQVTVAIYDPAVYYGHREIDIALTRLFGGFSTAFYETYNEVYPLQNGWQQRLPLFQLSHLLLHAVLFGGSYVGQCKEIMKQ